MSDLSHLKVGDLCTSKKVLGGVEVKYGIEVLEEADYTTSYNTHFQVREYVGEKPGFPTHEFPAAAVEDISHRTHTFRRRVVSVTVWEYEGYE